MKIIRDESRPECGEIHFNDEDPIFKALAPKMIPELIWDLANLKIKHLKPLKK